MDSLCSDIILDILFKDWKFIHPLSLVSHHFNNMIETHRLTIAKHYTKNNKLPNGKIHGHYHIYDDKNRHKYDKTKDIYMNYSYGKKHGIQVIDNKTDLITQYTYWINGVMSKGLCVHYNYKKDRIVIYQDGRYKETIIYKQYKIPTIDEFMNTQFMAIYNKY